MSALSLLRRSAFSVLLLILVASASSCDGNGSPVGSYSGDDVVTGLKAGPSALTVGESSIVKVSFSPAIYTPPDTDLSDNDSPSDETAAFDLVILLPPGLDFVEGTSKLTDSFLGDVIFGSADPRGPNRRDFCPDGSFYLLYQFSTDELSVNTPVDQVIAFRTMASRATGTGSIRSEAAPDLSSDPCSINPEKSFSVTLG